MTYDFFDYLFENYREDPCLTGHVEAARRKLQENPVVSLEHGDGLLLRLSGGDLVQLCAPAPLPEAGVPNVNVFGHLGRRDSRGRTTPVNDVRSITDGRKGS